MSQTYQEGIAAHAEPRLEKARHAKHLPYGTKQLIGLRTDVAKCTAVYQLGRKQKQDGREYVKA